MESLVEIADFNHVSLSQNKKIGKRALLPDPENHRNMDIPNRLSGYGTRRAIFGSAARHAHAAAHAHHHIHHRLEAADFHLARLLSSLFADIIAVIEMIVNMKKFIYAKWRNVFVNFGQFMQTVGADHVGTAYQTGTMRFDYNRIKPEFGGRLTSNRPYENVFVEAEHWIRP